MISDLKFAIRQLLKNPGFSAVAVLTLALGVGAVTAIFSVVNAVLLRSLPYAEPDRLVRIYSEFPGFPNGGLRRFAFSGPEFLDLRRETTSWKSLDAWVTLGVNVGGDTHPTRATASAISGDLLGSLGAVPLLGRVLTPEDDVPGGPQVVVISYGLWQRAFAGDPGILGRDFLLNGGQFSVVGVMPESFQFPPGEMSPTELWVPIQVDPANPGGRADHGLNLVGRLRAGVSLEQAQAEIESLEKFWSQTGSGHVLDGTNHTIVSYGLHDEVVRGVRPALRMLLGAVAFLLLIACVNVANLLLARAESRQREIAVRCAVGAGLRRLGTQFVVEGLLLASMGVAVGLVMAFGGLKLLKSASLATLPRAGEIAIDAPVVLFAVTLSLVTGLVFGLAPLVHVVRRNLHHALKSAASSTTGVVRAQRFRQGLVVGQLALSLTLLIGAGLMLRGFWNLQEVNAGFDSKGVLTMSVALPGATYRGQEVHEFWTRLKGRLDALPGFEGVALVSGLPPHYSSTHSDTTIEGYVPTPDGPLQNVEFYQSVSPGYFETLRIRLIEGRFFDERDSPDSPEVVIVNQTMARTFWGSASALGRRVRPSGTTNWCTIVGVVSDSKNGGLENPTGTELYLPFTQNAGRGRSQRMFIVVRGAGEPSGLVGVVRRELRTLDPALPVAEIRTLGELMTAAQSRPRFLTVLLTLFAGVALILATVGIYGVIAYSVALRMKEIGLRMALGAQHRDVLGIVLGRGMLLTVCGIALGLVGAWVLTRFLGSLLFGITASDPATFVVVSIIFSAVALIATYIPARRATRIQAMEALRSE
ncbi:MAG: ABC transporter permease [Verrucomicrobiae bacterium]|nr:ABC transporter permease [Verrucomicrobiae bacterium]